MIETPLAQYRGGGAFVLGPLAALCLWTETRHSLLPRIVQCLKKEDGFSSYRALSSALDKGLIVLLSFVLPLRCILDDEVSDWAYFRRNVWPFLASQWPWLLAVSSDLGACPDEATRLILVISDRRSCLSCSTHQLGNPTCHRRAY